MAEQNALKRNVLSAQVDLSKFNFDDSVFEKATDEEKKQQDVMSESTTFFKDGMKKLMKNPLAVGSIIVLILIMSVIIVAPHIVPYSYSQIISVNGKRDKTAKNLKPFEYSENELEYIAEGGEVFPHIMGTDAQCRDYFIRVGLLYGSISGYMGGKVDLIMQRIVDIIYSLPDMLVIILLSVVLNETLAEKLEGTSLQSLGVNMISLFIVYGLLYWVSMSRLVRGQILTIKNNEYVLAAKATGAKSGRIIAKHIIPNCISVIIISTALQIPSAIFTESYLSFIGLGVQGAMASDCAFAQPAR